MSLSQDVQDHASTSYQSGQMSRVLELWLESAEGKAEFDMLMKEKAIKFVEDEIHAEMDNLKSLCFFRIKTPEFLLGLTLDGAIKPLLTKATPITYKLILAALQTKRAEEENTHKTPDQIAPVIMAQLVKHRSQNALLFAIPYALAQWAAGVPHQAIDICAKIGLSIDYTSLGLARVAIADGCMAIAREAARQIHMLCYDNM
ncbi:hypothetical protein BV25DRAFT_1914812 [Artomyces pyxidatus]|uniref:Uncharacterized protein n=1 Tax=Artomyces pyxidatus TaxID=48021 RepID=A0ACB8T649_9AGAM|nr:hypothetical protein BV25DRAFT_1914812 [Artomyces pyxidatus]